jgi:hypothetical protein
MTPSDVAQRRFHNQHIAGTAFRKASEVVAWMGAVQAQEYLSSLWAVGLRTRDAIEPDIEQAVWDRTIVRSWPMRGTLHFVASADLRWMLKLLAPRVIARSASRYRQLELEGKTFLKCHAVLARALQGGKQLTRLELATAFELAGIATGGGRLMHIIARAAMEGLICHGTRRGKQFTFALLAEWVWATNNLTQDEALSELAKRYFTSHGPATLEDFKWWSGLTTAEVKAGLGSIDSHLKQASVDGRTHWFAKDRSRVKDVQPAAYFLPAFDEFLVGYKDRSAVLGSHNDRQPGQRNTGSMLSPTIVINGRVVGTWKRMLNINKGSAIIVPTLFTSLSRTEKQAVAGAAVRYGAFLRLRPVLAWQNVAA